MAVCDRAGSQVLHHHVSLVTLMRAVPEESLVTLSHEHTDFAWVDGVQGRAWHPGHEGLLRRVFDYIQATGDYALVHYPEKISVTM
jgi:hypothetical protein